MLNLLVGVFCGIIMGCSTVLYITSITKGMEIKKRLKVIKWVGIPLGIVMSLLAMLIGRIVL